MFPFTQLKNWITENQMLIYSPQEREKSIYHLHQSLIQLNIFFVWTNLSLSLSTNLLTASLARDFENVIAKEKQSTFNNLDFCQWFPWKTGRRWRQRIKDKDKESWYNLKTSNVAWLILLTTKIFYIYLLLLYYEYLQLYYSLTIMILLKRD